MSNAGSARDICVINAIAAPMAGGSRSERWANLGRALAERGHRLTMLRGATPWYAREDAFLARLIDHPRFETIALPTGVWPQWRGYNPSAGALAFVKRLVAESRWPEEWVGFPPRALKWLRQSRRKFDVTVTSGAPFSDFLVGYELARRGRAPWIAGYGDPWNLLFERGAWRRMPGWRFERHVIRRASAVTVTTAATADLLAREFGLARDRIFVVPAGVPDPGYGPPPPAPPVTVFHAGAVYGPRIPMIPFARAVGRIQQKQDLALNWFGAVHRPDECAAIRAVAARYVERASLTEVAEAEQQAHVIVIFGNYGGVQIPGKVWRTLGAKRIPLVVCEPNDAMYSLPELCERALFADNNEEAIARQLETAIQRTLKGEFEVRDASTPLPRWSDRARVVEQAIDAAIDATRRGVIPRSRVPAWSIAQTGMLAGWHLREYYKRGLKRVSGAAQH